MASDIFNQEHYGQWILPLVALREAAEVLGNEYLAAEGIMQRLKGGVILAGAGLAVQRRHKLEVDRTIYKLVNPNHWSGLGGAVATHDFWKLTDVELWLGENHYITYYGLRFEPWRVRDWLAAIKTPERAAAAPETPLANAQAAKNSGGRPPKDFWDDMLIAMFQRLWSQNWQPKTQAEVENAMLDWAAENGHKIGSTAVKIPAKKLFKLTKS